MVVADKTPTFKSSYGQFLTKALFLEESYENLTYVLFTLKDKDHRGYPSLYRLYMDLNDPTEYNFANAYLDGWEHWEALTASKWFAPYAARWRKELELRMKAKALVRLQDIARDEDSKYNYEANKYILSGQWQTKEDKAGKGRPTKADIASAAKIISIEETRLEEDHKRLLQVVN